MEEMTGGVPIAGDVNRICQRYSKILLLEI